VDNGTGSPEADVTVGVFETDGVFLPVPFEPIVPPFDLIDCHDPEVPEYEYDEPVE